MPGNREASYPKKAKLFAPHKKIRGWLLVQQLNMFKDGVLCGGKVDKIGHFASWKIWVDNRRLIVGVHLGGGSEMQNWRWETHFYPQHHVYGQNSTETTGCEVTEDSHHLSVEDMMIPQGS